MTTPIKTFREVCCERLEIPAEAFEETVLFQCLPPRHLPIGKLRWRLDPAYFTADLELIQTVADCTSVSELRAEQTYQRTTRPNSGFQRGVLRARLSGQRLVDFASKLLPP